jgi:hypothetical protein
MKLPSRSTLLLAAALLGAPLSGCARMPDVKPVRPAELGPNITLPLVIEFREGDRLPLELAIGGDLVGMETPGQSPVIVVKQRFFLVLHPSGPPHISLDGKTVGDVQGSFAFGVGANKERGPKATMRFDIVEKK